MANPLPTTRVTYPSGAVTGTGTVVAVVPLGDRTVVVTDVTPFHPVDHTWPDQPADRGTLAGHPVVDCITGASGPEGQVAWGTEIPVRRGEPGWTWLVGHVVADAGGIAPGGEVELAVDADHRRALSLGHTACHLAALALNAALAPMWTKEVDRLDSLGHPDFDSLAITDSKVLPLGATDSYRLGKGVRRKGLPTADLPSHLSDLAAQTNGLLAEWTAAGGAVAIETGGDESLTARRTWVAQIDGHSAEIPCGGTHVTDLSELGTVTIAATVTDEGFATRTTVHPG